MINSELDSVATNAGIKAITLLSHLEKNDCMLFSSTANKLPRPISVDKNTEKY